MAFKKSIDAGSAEIFGTKKAGYADAATGPFRCDHCKFYRAGDRCIHDRVVSDPAMTIINGLAKIEDGGCCTYFHPGDKHAASSGTKTDADATAA